MEEKERRFKQLGLNISYYRKMRNLSQEELAEKAHISRSHISRIEAPNMQKQFSITAIFSIADALDIEVKDLFDFNRR